MLPQAQVDDRELDEGREVHRQLVEASADAAAILQPADGLLNDVSPPIGLTVEPRPRKAEVVLRLFRGETLDALSRELGVTPGKLADWRDEALARIQAGLQSHEPDHCNGFIHDFKAKVGYQSMQGLEDHPVSWNDAISSVEVSNGCLVTAIARGSPVAPESHLH